MYFHFIGYTTHRKMFETKISKVSLCTCNEGVWWSGGIVPFILNIGTSWKRVISSTPGRLTTGEKKPRDAR